MILMTKLEIKSSIFKLDYKAANYSGQNKMGRSQIWPSSQFPKCNCCIKKKSATNSVAALNSETVNKSSLTKEVFSI